MNMELKQLSLHNTGMSQDKAISVEDNKYAYKNRNIRIISPTDSTMQIVTNYRGGKRITKTANIQVPADSILMNIDLSIYKNGVDTGTVVNANCIIPDATNVSTSINVSMMMQRQTPMYFTCRTMMVNESFDYGKVPGFNTKYYVLNIGNKLTISNDSKYANSIVNSSYNAEDDRYIYSGVGAKFIIKNLYVNTGVTPVTLVNANTITGTLLTSCITPDYLVIFAKDGNTDKIYRITLDELVKGDYTLRTLYSGTELNFHTDRHYNTVYYEENANVKKIYWCESWKESETDNNKLRFINLVTEGERYGGTKFTRYTENKFEFYPLIGKAPRVKIQKLYNQDSDLPAGVIQYFITYYNENGAETKVCQDTSLITLHPKDRGSKEDEKGNCVVQISISEYSTDFDYIRIYSAARSTLNGSISAHIVADLKIPDSGGELSFIDNYKAQETIQDTQLFFIGGTALCANTIDEKQGTLFAGNVYTEQIMMPQDIKDLFNPETSKYITNITNEDGIVLHQWSKLVKFTRKNQVYLRSAVEEDTHSLVWWDEHIEKGISDENVEQYFSIGDNIEKKNKNSTNVDDLFTSNATLLDNVLEDFFYKELSYKEVGDNLYAYALNTVSSKQAYTGFKFGEIYRFGLQFQNTLGEWTDVLYIGDGECRCAPGVDAINKFIYYTNAVVKLPQELIDKCKGYGYNNYRLVYADPELSNGRNIVAQGILCPTVFSPLKRYMKTNWVDPSWIFRPLNGDAPYHHFQRMASYWDRTSEIASVKGNESVFSIPTDIQQSYEKAGGTYSEDSVKKITGKKNVLLTIVKQPYIYMFSFVMTEDGYKSMIFNKDTISNLTGIITTIDEDLKVTGSIQNALSQLQTNEKACLKKTISINIPNTFTDILSDGASDINLITATGSRLYSTNPAQYYNWCNAYMKMLFWSSRKYSNNNSNALSYDENFITNFVNYYNIFESTILHDLGESSGNAPETYKEAKKDLLVDKKIIDASVLYKDVVLNNWKKNLKEVANGGFLFLPIEDELSLYANTYEAESDITYSKDIKFTGFKYFFDYFSIKEEEYNIKEKHINTFINITSSEYSYDQITNEIPETKQIATYMNNDSYFVDNSVVTFNTPEIDNLQGIKNNKMSLDVIGSAIINGNYGKKTIELSQPGRWVNAEIQNYNEDSYIGKTNTGYSLKTLLSEYSLCDRYLQNVVDGSSDKKETITVLRDDSLTYFMTHMWEISGSITGIDTKNTDLSKRITDRGLYEDFGPNNKDNPLVTDYATIKYNRTYNYKFAEETNYVIGEPDNTYITGPVNIANESSVNLDTEYFDSYIYSTEVNKMILGKSNIKYVTNGATTEYLKEEPFTKKVEDNTSIQKVNSPIKVQASNNPLLDSKFNSDPFGQLEYADGFGPNSNTYREIINDWMDLWLPNESDNGGSAGLDDFSNKHRTEDTTIEELNGLEGAVSDDVMKIRLSNALKQGPTRITYKETPHAIFTLGTTKNGCIAMLPYIQNEDKFDNEQLYCGGSNNKFYDEKIRIVNYPWASEKRFNYDLFFSKNTDSLLKRYTQPFWVINCANHINLTSLFEAFYTTPALDTSKGYKFQLPFGEINWTNSINIGGLIGESVPTTLKEFFEKESDNGGTNKTQIAKILYDKLSVSMTNSIANVMGITKENDKYILKKGYFIFNIVAGVESVRNKYFETVETKDNDDNDDYGLSVFKCNYDLYSFLIKVNNVSKTGKDYDFDYTVVEIGDFFGYDCTEVNDNTFYNITSYGNCGKITTNNVYSKTYNPPLLLDYKNEDQSTTTKLDTIFTIVNDFETSLATLTEVKLDYNKLSELEKINLKSLVDNKVYFENFQLDSSISSPEHLLLIGELKRNLEHKDLYGGFSEQALQKLTWLPASNYTPIDSIVYQSWGDTYFQRYDCLKTYPRSEEDMNQVTDIASVMIETHQNLDTRTDVNRWNFNTMARPDNFGLYNSVYNQKDNLFTGSVLPELMNFRAYNNMIVWSNTKNIAGTIDSWTNLSLNSYAKTREAVTKIINYNENLFVFEPNYIERIIYKDTNLVNTDSANSPIRVDFNDKVVVLPWLESYGSNNPNVLVTQAGLYYVDDERRTIYRIGLSSNQLTPTPIGKDLIQGFFNENITKYSGNRQFSSDIRFYYDVLNKDVFIMLGDKHCVIYNETLDTCISFLDCNTELMGMFTKNNKTFAFKNGTRSTWNNPSIYEMYVGKYNQFFDTYLPYEIEYRVNTSPLDTVYTNIEFLADLGTSKDNSTKNEDIPFKTVQVYNEYQDTGTVTLTYDRYKSSNLKQKFRTWRAVIPRSKTGSGRDRIRNPWIHLILKNDPQKDVRLDLHSMIVDCYV